MCIMWLKHQKIELLYVFAKVANFYYSASNLHYVASIEGITNPVHEEDNNIVRYV